MLGLGHLALRESFNRTLTLTVLLIAISQFNFGFDQQGFSSTQAMDAFDRQFGKWDPEKKKWYLPTVWLSFFNSFNYLGQAFGTVQTTHAPCFVQY
jgi:MFS transporter, SP family, sugar:H+ symporter